MPSPKNYKRDYVQERKTESDDRKRFRAERNKARRMLEQDLGHPLGKRFDVDHVVPLSKGGKNELSNLRLIPASDNRSFPRTKTGRMKNVRSA